MHISMQEKFLGVMKLVLIFVPENIKLLAFECWLNG